MPFLQALEEVATLLIAFGYGVDTEEVLDGFEQKLHTRAGSKHR
jgi:hypothetical protein